MSANAMADIKSRIGEMIARDKEKLRREKAGLPPLEESQTQAPKQDSAPAKPRKTNKKEDDLLLDDLDILYGVDDVSDRGGDGSGSEEEQLDLLDMDLEPEWDMLEKG